jgi:hypothetical protein
MQRARVRLSTDLIYPLVLVGLNAFTSFRALVPNLHVDKSALGGYNGGLFLPHRLQNLGDICVSGTLAAMR